MTGIHVQPKKHIRSLTDQIPKIIHQSWKSADEIPIKLKHWMQSWREFNPSYEYMFWDDTDNLKLFQVHFPHLYHVAKVVKKIQLADMARVALLYQYGGIYVDGDFECLQSFDNLLHFPLFLSREPQVHATLLYQVKKPRLWNAILASRPRHPFWLSVLDAIRMKVESGENIDNPLEVTGPGAFDPVYATWRGIGDDSVIILREEFFYPEIAPWGIANMTSKCNVSVQDPSLSESCTWLAKYLHGHYTTNTFAVHRWECSWCHNDESKRVVSLQDIFPSSSIGRPDI